MGSPSGLSGSAARNHIFELVAGDPALDLVNTLDWRFRDEEPEELLNSYSHLLRFTEQSHLLTSRQARRLKRIASDRGATQTLASVTELREAAAVVFYAAVDGIIPPASTVKALEASFKESHEHQRLSWSESRIIWDWPEPEASLDVPLWLLALSAERLMTSDELSKVRACSNPECRWLFLDTSKNHTRRWCEMKVCGNRMKARRFKAQRRA